MSKGRYFYLKSAERGEAAKAARNMITTTNLNELFQIVNVEHGDPHHVLGMHEIEHNNKKFVTVRAFIPQAKEIIIIDDKEKKKNYPMMKIHEDGFFEGIIEDRKEWFTYQLSITDYQGHHWTTYDPYSFAPTISEYDRYLFGAGNHYEIFKKLGAHITTVNGVEGVAFGVWAPNAKAVSVIGNFNNWDSRRNQMRILGESGIWELFIPGLKQYDQYKFQVKDKNNHVCDKADPYAFFAQVRPETASVVYDSSHYTWNDKTWMQDRSGEHIYQGPVNIYEVHLGSWRRVPEEGNRSITYLEAAENWLSM